MSDAGGRDFDDAESVRDEIMDADAALARLKHDRPQMPGFVIDFVRDHFNKEHLLPDQVGLLAAHAGAHELVLTHFGGATGEADQIPRLTRIIGAEFTGPIHFANDLDRF